ncbi:DUF7344 domain-containing protein [Haloprofundus salilacus]|uniref:DUF7344 domain-containing protein n=1 Tax=Haloprofundus salilacus TaxID=2876190 RepID=UPI001CC97E61|nr:hypothetical protein [Haloprofundus salilacus]
MTDQQPPTGTGDASELSRALAVLSNPCRRRIVALLSERRASISLSELTSLLAADDDLTGGPNGADGETEADTDSLAITLHHVHLPMLSDGGFAEYDPVRRTVVPGPRIDDENATDLLTLVETLAESEFHLFSTAPMRATLAVLVDTSGVELPVSTVTAQLVAHVGGPRKTHAARLRHYHLPKLDAAGVVDYDVNRSTVSLRANSALLDASFSPATS